MCERIFKALSSDRNNDISLTVRYHSHRLSDAELRPAGELATKLPALRLPAVARPKSASSETKCPSCEFRFNPAWDSDLMPAAIPK